MLKEIEPHPKFKHAMLFIACLITFLPASAAADGGYNVQVTDDYVKATTKCSCGQSGYYYHTASFENYCPQCHSHGSLKFNPKGTVEGEWTCTQCDADYCSAEGKEKIGGSNYYLKHYTAPKKIVHAQTVETKVQTPEPEDPKTKIIKTLSLYKDRSFLG